MPSLIFVNPHCLVGGITAMLLEHGCNKLGVYLTVNVTLTGVARLSALSFAPEHVAV